MHTPGRLAIVLGLLLVTAPAFAADPVAESMFEEAVKLMQAGDFKSACPKLQASQKLEAKSGTLMTLGSCNEQLGKTATAWAEYKEAAALARTEGRASHADKATKLAAAVEPKLSKVRIDAQASQGGTELTVRLDGNVVLSGTFGVAFAIDPGKHTLDATAPGKKTWSTAVDAVPAGTKVVAIPELESAAPDAPAAAVAPAPAPTPAPVTPTPAPPAGHDAVQKGGVPTWAWVVGGVGVASLVASVVFVADEGSASSALNSHCGGADRNLCPPTYDFAADRSRETRDFGMFIGFGLGGAALVGAAVYGIVTAGPKKPATDSAQLTHVTPWFGPGTAGLGVDTRF